MSLSKERKTIICLGFLNAVVWILFYGVIETPDSMSYISAWDNLLRFVPDSYRTPIYPLYLGVLRTIFGIGFFKIAAVIGQYLFFTLSALAYYSLSFRIIDHPKIAYWLSIIYLLFPGLFAWNNEILTESFSISGMVFLLYSVLLLYERASALRVVGLFLSLLFIIFLRPSFVYLVPVLCLFWLISLFKIGKVHSAFLGAVISVCVGFLYAGYVAQFHKAHGIWSPTIVSNINRYYIARQYGLLMPADATTANLNKIIEKQIINDGEQCSENELLWEEVFEVVENASPIEISEALNNSQRSKPLSHIKALCLRTYQAGYTFIFRGSTHFMTLVWNYLVGIQIRHVYLFLFVYFIAVMTWIFYNRQIPICSLLLFLVGASNLIVVIIGAQSDWGRLNVSVIPIYFLMISQFIKHIDLKFQKRLVVL